MPNEDDPLQALLRSMGGSPPPEPAVLPLDFSTPPPAPAERPVDQTVAPSGDAMPPEPAAPPAPPVPAAEPRPSATPIELPHTHRAPQRGAAEPSRGTVPGAARAAAKPADLTPLPPIPEGHKLWVLHELSQWSNPDMSALLVFARDGAHALQVGRNVLARLRASYDMDLAQGVVRPHVHGGLPKQFDLAFHDHTLRPEDFGGTMVSTMLEDLGGTLPAPPSVWHSPMAHPAGEPRLVQIAVAAPSELDALRLLASTLLHLEFRDAPPVEAAPSADEVRAYNGKVWTDAVVDAEAPAEPVAPAEAASEDVAPSGAAEAPAEEPSGAAEPEQPETHGETTEPGVEPEVPAAEPPAPETEGETTEPVADEAEATDESDEETDADEGEEDAESDDEATDEDAEPSADETVPAEGAEGAEATAKPKAHRAASGKPKPKKRARKRS